MITACAVPRLKDAGGFDRVGSEGRSMGPARKPVMMSLCARRGARMSRTDTVLGRSVSALLTAVIIGWPSHLAAQAVRGRLVDATTGSVVTAGLVQLTDTAGKEIDRGITGETGGFFLRAQEAGEYRLRAERLGYRTASSAPIQLKAGEVRHVEFLVGIEAIELEPLRVVAEARTARLEHAGFYNRRSGGLGLFITRDEFDLRRPRYATDILRGAPGVRVVPAPNGNTIRFMRSEGAGFRGCAIRIWVDGMLVGDENTFDFLHPDDIEAVEVYRGIGGIPAQYGGAESACGVILVWTRTGGSQRWP